ncbi:MAG: HlyD family efflux transporter periplasmic adaptor subunit [Schwartzia sp.]|nr:HlyD family efflux transporter periplasmic adaptor subunit [Schwartzia sp. (in: firmicutes)]
MSFNQIFQQKALDKLKRPEKAGAVFSITSSTGWIALAAVGISLFSVLVWAFFGVMAEQVTGYGIIVDDSGVANISPISSGRILEMRCKVGESVARGDVVAVIEQTQLEQQVYLTAEQAQTATSYEDMRARTAQLASAKEEYHHQAQVISPYNGIISSQRLRAGEIVQAGAPLYDVDVKESQDLISVVFVPALTGNKLKPGSTIQVSPGAIDSSLYGSLMGTVLELSPYPVTSDRVVYWTGNKEFANWIMQKCGGAIMEVRVELTRDQDTKSGYLWTTLLGPDEEIKEGMTCTATAIVDRRSPAAYAFDKLGQWLRTD